MQFLACVSDITTAVRLKRDSDALQKISSHFIFHHFLSLNRRDWKTLFIYADEIFFLKKRAFVLNCIKIQLNRFVV